MLLAVLAMLNICGVWGQSYWGQLRGPNGGVATGLKD